MICVGDWVTYPHHNLGLGQVVMDLGGGIVRVKFARTESSVYTQHLRPAPETEKRQAVRT